MRLVAMAVKGGDRGSGGLSVGDYHARTDARQGIDQKQRAAQA